MDAETQLVEASPHATIEYKAAHHSGLAHGSHDHGHSQHHEITVFAPPATAGAPVVSADGQNSQIQPNPATTKLPDISSAPSPSVTTDPQLTDAAARNTVEKQLSVSVSTAMVQSKKPLPAAQAASNPGGSSMDALLQAMLTGSLTP